jgi:hypothetical protein
MRDLSLTGSALAVVSGFFDKLVNRGKRNVDSGALAASQRCEAKDFGGPVSSYSLKSYALHRV